VIADDWYKIIGPEVEKYLAKKNDRAALAQFIQKYYTDRAAK
jgi:hypothetical protein